MNMGKQVSQKLTANLVVIATYSAKTFKKSVVLAAECTIFITQIAPGDSNVGFRPEGRAARTQNHLEGENHGNQSDRRRQYRRLPRTKAQERGAYRADRKLPRPRDSRRPGEGGRRDGGVGR